MGAPNPVVATRYNDVKILRKSVWILRGRDSLVGNLFPYRKRDKNEAEQGGCLINRPFHDFREPFAVKERLASPQAAHVQYVPTLLQVWSYDHSPIKTELDGLFCYFCAAGLRLIATV